MLINNIYAIVSVLVVSLVSVIFAVPFLIKKKVSNGILLFLLSISVGVILGTVFFEFIPEIYLHGDGHAFFVPVTILSGFLLMFVIEKFVHFHHKSNCENKNCGHSHAYNLAPMNLIGDSVHNFIDGIVIAGAYIVNIPLGLITTLSIIFHEVPQEISDFGVLLYSGYSKKKAVLFNFLSALTAIIGTIFGLFVFGTSETLSKLIIPFATGNFIYIASSNLLPELHRHCKFWDSIVHIFAIILGIVIVVLVMAYGPSHVH